MSPVTSSFAIAVLCALNLRGGDETSKAAPTPPVPSFVGIGDLAGGEFHSEVSAISADGSTIVGWSSSAETAKGQFQAYKWTRKSGMVALGSFDGRVRQSNAGATTHDGSFVVGDAGSDDGSQAALWNETLEVTAVGSLGGTPRWNTARGISEDGRFVVGCSVSPRGYEAFLWERGKEMVGLGDAAGGAFNSSAQTVTRDGGVIFGCASVPAGVHLFRWTPDDGMDVLGDLEGGGTFAEPYAATPDGALCVGRAQSPASGAERFEAFRWTESTGLVGLGDLEGGEFESWALDVTDDGATIVGFGTTDDGQEAVLWTRDGELHRVADLIADDPNADVEGWTLTWASAISADGRTIAGHGRDPSGHTQGWIWRVPEPATK